MLNERLWTSNDHSVFYDLTWGAYGWTWDIVDFFVKSIHCPL